MASSSSSPTGDGPAERLWRVNDRRAQKSGERRTMYWVKKTPEEGHTLSNIGAARRGDGLQAGARYEGEWKDDKKHGYGLQVWGNGNKYEGEWANGKRDGHGTFWVKEGKALRKVYQGNWRAGLKHGLGVQFYKNGDRYEGQWERGVRQGEGTLFTKDGDVFVGHYDNNARTGFGTLTRANGDVYEGEWLADKKEGPGIYYYKRTEKILDGEWVNDVARCGVYLDTGDFFGENKDEEDADGDGDGEEEEEDGDGRKEKKKKKQWRNGRRFRPIPELELADAAGLLQARIEEIQAERYNIRALRVHGLADLFSDDDLDLLRGVFSSQDEEGQGVVPRSALQALLEGVGYALDESEVAFVLANLEKPNSRNLTFPVFCKAVHIARGL